MSLWYKPSKYGGRMVLPCFTIIPDAAPAARSSRCFACRSRRVCFGETCTKNSTKKVVRPDGHWIASRLRSSPQILAKFPPSNYSIHVVDLWSATNPQWFDRWSNMNGDHRRKFRSQTSDNMDRWKAEQGRGREKRKIRREKIRREGVRRKKMQMREKVGKSRNTMFFQWFGAPEGRKVGSPKRRVRSQLARWEMKKCMPLWREAHVEVKMYKAHQVRTTFGSWDVEKVHAVVARSTFASQKC